MNVKELYDHLLLHMTAEQALLKLLEGQVLNYEKLKFNEGEEVHPIFVISMAAIDMGWGIAIPNEDDEEIQGMIVGTQEYVDGVLKKDDNPPDHYDKDDKCCENGCSSSDGQNR